MILICLLLLGGCGASGTDQVENYEIAEAGTWTDGTYTETAKGKRPAAGQFLKIQFPRLSYIVKMHKETPCFPKK